MGKKCAFKKSLQVFDDVAIELTMALLQFFSEKPSEEHLFRTLKALSKFVTVNSTFFLFVGFRKLIGAIYRSRLIFRSWYK